MKRGLTICTALTTILLSAESYATDWQVQTRIEPTYSDHINLMIDAVAGNCTTGGWLFFYGAGSTTQDQRDSVKAVYAGLIASMYAGKRVIVSGINQGCVVQQVHLLSD